MFTKYILTLASDSESYSLTYDLESHHPAQEWARLMSALGASSLRPGFDSWHGLNANPTEKIDRLLQLAEAMNVWIPEKINTDWCVSKPQESLNAMHVHFPELERTETDPARLAQLTEYNDLIHQVEDLIRNDKYIWMQLLPETEERVALNEEDYSLFHASRHFGELCLHYPHVGRHPMELMKSQDFQCPVDQIVPQHLISAYHTLRYYDDPYTEDQYQNALIDFFAHSTLKDFCHLDDPHMAFGYITLGNLSGISREDALAIVRSTNRIVGWKII